MSRLDAPQDWADVGEVMTNFDHSVEPWAEDKLRSGEFVGHYPAWGFHAEVWWDGDQFNAAVRRYHVHVATVHASHLRGLMVECSERFGGD